MLLNNIINKNRLLLLTNLLSVSCPAFAVVNPNYQFGQPAVINEESVVLPITNHAIVLNPELDAINSNDPRIKAVINYVKTNGMGVTVLFSNPDNLRYVKKVNQMFTTNGVFATEPQLTKSKNIMDFNLVNVYVIKNPGVIVESSIVQKSFKSQNLDD